MDPTAIFCLHLLSCEKLCTLLKKKVRKITRGFCFRVSSNSLRNVISQINQELTHVMSDLLASDLQTHHAYSYVAGVGTSHLAIMQVSHLYVLIWIIHCMITQNLAFEELNIRPHSYLAGRALLSQATHCLILHDTTSNSKSVLMPKILENLSKVLH